MNVTVSSKLNQKAFFFGMVGFIAAAFLSVLTYGIGVGCDAQFRDNKFFPVGFNPFRDLALRCLFISMLLLVSVVLGKTRKKISLRFIALVSLAVTIHQSLVLMRSTSEMSNWITDYGSLLEGILYTGQFFLGIAVALMLLQVSLIWLIHRSSNLESP